LGALADVRFSPETDCDSELAEFATCGALLSANFRPKVQCGRSASVTCYPFTTAFA